jgi:hypothetical protein
LRRKRFWLMIVLGLFCLGGFAAGGVGAPFTDTEPSADNNFAAGVWGDWVQTSPADFQAGVLYQVDTSSSPGDVELAANETNVASQANGGIASASSEHSKYRATNTNDGNNATSWRAKDKRPQWLQINFTSNKTINKMVLYWVTYCGIDFRLQIWNGTGWVTVDDVTGNSDLSYISTFDPVTTDAIRYYETDGTHPQKAGYVVEFEAYPAAYHSSGSIASKVYDTGKQGTGWDELFWNETVGEGVADITFEVRASDNLFAKDAPQPDWIDLGTADSPIASGLPSGRYMQWRATLTTTDYAQTPVLHDVTVSYSS